jgi:hypothetical protein
MTASVFYFIRQIRGYWFVNRGDSLTHLGIAHDLYQGSEVAGQTFYPAIHNTSIMINQLSGLSLSYSLFLIPSILALVFALILPLCVRLVSSKSLDFHISVILSATIPPISGIASSLVPHASTQAVLFVSVVFFTHVYLINRPNNRRIYLIAIFCYSSLIIFHPQQAFNTYVYLLSGYACILLIETRSNLIYNKIHSKNYTYYILIISILLVSWLVSFNGIIGSGISLLQSIYNIIRFGIVEGNETTQTAAIVVDGTTGFVLLFIKTYGEDLLLSLLTVILLLTSIYKKSHRLRSRTYSFYAFFGLVPILFLALGLAFGKDIFQGLRYVAFIMLFATVFGSIGLGYLVDEVSSLSKRQKKTILIVLIIGIVMISAAGMFRSPFINLPSSGIPEQQPDGYQTVIDYRSQEIKIQGLRGNVKRFSDATLGTAEARNSNLYTYDGRSLEPGFTASSLANPSSDPSYVILTSTDEYVESEMYDGRVHSSEELSTLDTHNKSVKFYSNPEFRAYLVTTYNDDSGTV